MASPPASPWRTSAASPSRRPAVRSCAPIAGPTTTPACLRWSWRKTVETRAQPPADHSTLGSDPRALAGGGYRRGGGTSARGGAERDPRLRCLRVDHRRHRPLADGQPPLLG